LLAQIGDGPGDLLGVGGQRSGSLMFTGVDERPGQGGQGTSGQI
jgi:hypothetical protein